MRYKLDIKGVIIPNDYKDFYDWFGADSTCPKDVASVLDGIKAGDGLDVYINSPGGIIEAGSEIYALLREAAGYADLKIYVIGQACSAASVIACAGYCEMAPTALMMVHCVSTHAGGNHNDMEHAAEVLRTADRSICAAYVSKSGMSEEEALEMMEHETWLTAEQAKEKGMIDAVMFEDADGRGGNSLPMVAGPLFALPTDEQMAQFRRLSGEFKDIDREALICEMEALRIMNIKSPRGQKGSNDMIREQYEDRRKALMGECQAFIDQMDAEGARAKRQEIEDLDEQWEKACEEQANLNALMSDRPCLNIQSLTDANAEGKIDGGAASGKVVIEPADPMKPEDAYRTEAYASAWAKVMMNRPLTDGERRVMKMVNEDFTHTTENTPVVIPETVASGIWAEIADMYPYWSDIAKTFVKGKMSVIKSESSAAASWYEEGTATESVQEAFGKIELNGCELSRAITVSWKLREMAVEDFIPYIQRAMAERMGAGLGYGVTKGAGIVDGQPSEPKGVVTALLAEEGAPQVISYTENELSYTDLTSARGKIKSGYTPSVYANSNTIWNVLANVLDTNGRPIFIADPMAGGVYRILGCVVKEDASFADGEILFSDAGRGYTANVNRDITVQTEEHVKARETDYCGYAIVDGAPLTQKAHALLTVGE